MSQVLSFFIHNDTYFQFIASKQLPIAVMGPLDHDANQVQQRTGSRLSKSTDVEQSMPHSRAQQIIENGICILECHSITLDQWRFTLPGNSGAY